MRHSSYEELYKKAIKAGKYNGLGDESEDFAGWIVIKWLEGKAQHQTLGQSIIEYRRKHHADPGHPGGLAKLIGKDRTISIGPIGSDTQLNFDIERSLAGCLGDDSGISRPNLYPQKFLTGRNLEIYNLYTVEELTLKQIADKFEVTESRISQKISEIKKEIFKMLGLQIMLERCEIDETEMVIDWIIL